MMAEKLIGKNGLSLSIEPLLLNEVYEPTVVEKQCER